MLVLPATVTAREATDTRRMLAQSMKGLPANDEVVVDASALRQFDSSALAVLLDCERQAEGLGQRLVLRGAPPKLVALARLYGVDELLGAGFAGDPAVPSEGGGTGTAGARPD